MNTVPRCTRVLAFAGSRIERPFQGDVEAPLLGPRAVVGEVEAFFDDGVDVDRPVLAGALARVQQHTYPTEVGNAVLKEFYDSLS